MTVNSPATPWVVCGTSVVASKAAQTARHHLRSESRAACRLIRLVRRPLTYLSPRMSNGCRTNSPGGCRRACGRPSAGEGSFPSALVRPHALIYRQHSLGVPHQLLRPESRRVGPNSACPPLITAHPSPRSLPRPQVRGPDSRLEWGGACCKPAHACRCPTKGWGDITTSPPLRTPSPQSTAHPWLPCPSTHPPKTALAPLTG